MRQRLFIGGGSLFIRQTHPGTPFLILGKTVGVVLINQAQGPLFAGKPSGEGARILPADIHHRVVFSLGKAGPGRSFPSGSFQEFLKVLYAHFVGHDQSISSHRDQFDAQAVGPGRAKNDRLVRFQLQGKV